jgi:hypothetical protein
LDFALAVNVSAFEGVHVVAENVPQPPLADDHLFWSSVDLRWKFSMLLAVAGVVAGPTDLVVLANCDIVIPRSTLTAIDRSILPFQAYCLTRWEIEGDWAMRVWDVGYSQDVWVFRGPPRDKIGGDYWFGVPGCDNRLSHELRAAGYEVRNPSKSLPTYHIHASHQRTATNTQEHRVPPPYLYLTPCRLGELQETVEALTLEERKSAFQARRRGIRRRRQNP